MSDTPTPYNFPARPLVAEYTLIHYYNNFQRIPTPLLVRLERVAHGLRATSFFWILIGAALLSLETGRLVVLGAIVAVIAGAILYRILVNQQRRAYKAQWGERDDACAAFERWKKTLTSTYKWDTGSGIPWQDVDISSTLRISHESANPIGVFRLVNGNWERVDDLQGPHWVEIRNFIAAQEEEAATRKLDRQQAAFRTM